VSTIYEFRSMEEVCQMPRASTHGLGRRGERVIDNWLEAMNGVGGRKAD
jgi:hypothetical protein